MSDEDEVMDESIQEQQKPSKDLIEEIDITEIEITPENLKTMSLEELRTMKKQLRKVITNNRVAQDVIFKRENKNRPRETSSKWREKPERPKIRRRDPRFEESCGTLSLKAFREDYQFLDDIREKEVKEIKKQARKEKRPERKEELLKLKQRLENQDREWSKRREEKELQKKVREEAMMTTGKSYVNKSQLKAVTLVHKYKELKKSGRLMKYLEKKRKKNVDKDRKKGPFS